MQRSSNIGNNLTKITVPGNGDCFYHALMIDIIHGVLTDKLVDGSSTAARIKTLLMPEITRQLVRRGKPEINFTGVSLKQALMELMRTVPIAELNIPQSSSLIFALDDSDSQEIRIIKNCNLYHLLIDICSPAIRNIMLAGMQEYKNKLEMIVKEDLEREFSSFIIAEYGDKLKVDTCIIIAANNQLSGGELYDAGIYLRTATLASWSKSFQDEFDTLTEYRNYNDYIKATFESWWNRYHKQAWELYRVLHTSPGRMAGKPQQISLALMLFCNFKIVKHASHQLNALTQELDQQHSFLFLNWLSHVDAMVDTPPGDKYEKITHALLARMDAFEIKREIISATTHPWSRDVPVDLGDRPSRTWFAFTDEQQSRLSGAIRGAINPLGFGLWRPIGYMQMLAETTPDQHTIAAARPDTSESPDISKMLQLD